MWLPVVLLFFARRQYSPLVKSTLLFPAMGCLVTKVILIRHTLLGKHIYHRNAHLTACPMPMHVGVVWVCGVQVDLDGNGLINFAEFVTMMRKCKVDTDFDRQIREAFKVRRAGVHRYAAPRVVDRVASGPHEDTTCHGRRSFFRQFQESKPLGTCEGQD